jgi:hypothetical protein
LSASASGFRGERGRGRERGIFSAAHCRAEAVRAVRAVLCLAADGSLILSLSKPQASDLRIRFEGFVGFGGFVGTRFDRDEVSEVREEQVPSAY